MKQRLCPRHSTLSANPLRVLAAGLLTCLGYVAAATPVVTAAPAPLAFLENKGQVTDQYYHPRTDIQYALTPGDGLRIFIGNAALHYQFQRPAEKNNAFTTYRMDVCLAGANTAATYQSQQPLSYYEHYYTPGTGANGALAHTYGKVVYKDVYPGIDWVLYTEGGRLKHEFTVHAGADISRIKLQYTGATGLHINAGGDLVAATPEGTITEHAPDTYDGNGRRIASSFVLDGNTVTYKIDRQPSGGDVTIDPLLEWATYYGGTAHDGSKALALDAAGANVYMSGHTSSPASIATVGTAQQTLAGGYDAFLVKFSASGTRQWATYMGTADDEFATGVAVSNTAVAIAGYTNSDSSLATLWSAQYTGNGGTEAFVTSFDLNGARLWSTYYGGAGDDTAWSAASDAWGNIYVCGRTGSTSNIAAGAGFQLTNGGGDDGFLIKFSASGAPLWGTYYGGGGEDVAASVRTDNFGNVIIGGRTTSPSGIASGGAYQSTLSGGSDAFVAKFSNTGSQLWASYYGGTDYDDGVVGVDIYSNVYLAGTTASAAGIASTGAWQTVFDTITDAYLVKFDQSGTRQWATYYGGHDSDEVKAVNGDAVGNVYITGLTFSTMHISTTGALQGSSSGNGDGYVAKFSGSGNLRYATYYAGSLRDAVNDVACDNTGHLYMVGTTSSPTGIATFGGHQAVAGGGFLSDAFMAKFKDMWTTEVATLPAGRVLSLYPNPSQGQFHVVTGSAGRLELYSADGRYIATYTFQAGDNALAMPQWLAPGIYAGRFTDASGNVATISVSLVRE